MSNGLFNPHSDKHATNGATAPALPVAIIGAGPVGLAAAAHLVERNLPFVVFEAGPRVGHSMLDWGHVQMFSPWQYSVDPAAVRLLEETGWHTPEPESYPTGRMLVERYLAALAAHSAIAPHVHLNHRVTHVTRAGFDKMKTDGREQAPFQLYIVGADGTEEIVHARAVIDASGTYTTPNPLGASGLPATGERALADRIVYGIPDVLGKERERYAGKRVLVAGSGHSAFNAILDLAALAEQIPDTSITWIVRRGEMARAYGGGESDALPARGELGQRIRALVEGGVVQLITGWRTDHLDRTPDGIVAIAAGQALAPVDEVIVATGLRPDLAMLGELRLGLDPAVEAPTALAPLIDPNVHSCGTVPPHGADELAHPEPNFYMIGMKSYGRAPTFLLLTGYEQARSVVAALAGDWEAARRVELTLPETGVCSGPVAAGGGAVASWCGLALDAPVGGTNLIALTPVGPNLATSSLNIELVATGGRAQAVAATGCCGGPAPAGADACCVQDAEAKAAGQDGCGCGTGVTYMMLPDYWLTRPSVNFDEKTQMAFDELLTTTLSIGGCPTIQFTLPWPKWQFLCHLADHHNIALHGSGDPNIALFEPRQSNDLNEFGNQKAIYAASDGLWAMFFAIVDRERVMSITNACIRLADETRTLQGPYYVFSVSQSVLPTQPWRMGTVYLLPRNTFTTQPPIAFGSNQVHIAQLASFVPVQPLAKLTVTPADFPFLMQIRGHDDQRLQEYATALQTGAPWPSNS